MGIADFFDLNRYAKFFKVGRMSEDLRQREAVQNSQGFSQEQFDLGLTTPTGSNHYNANHGGYGIHGMTSINIQFDQYFGNKAQRIATYREMARYPEISDALDNICDDGMTESSKGVMIELDIKEELPSHIEDEIKKQWDYMVEDIFNFSDNAWDLFRKWLVDGELYVELILNNEGDDIIGFKILPAHTMVPVYEDNNIVGYVQSVKPINVDAGSSYGTPTGPTGEDKNIYFDKDQIVYINYGDMGRNRYDIRGFLDASIRTYNQLKNLEDAVVIYRLVRAPERRIWNINVGRMPKTRADEYLRGVMQRYRKRIKYDSSTGAMDSAGNIQAMVEDFWFPKNADGEGTTVETLGAGQNLGEMQDVEYFLKKLYKTLKLPSSRWKDVSDAGSQMYSQGKSGEITREEIQFANFIQRLQKKFKPLLMDTFVTLLRLRDAVDKRYIDHSLYNVIFTEQNEYKEYKDLELLESRFALLGSIEAYIYKPEENENGYFSQEFVLRNWFMMTDEEYNKNKELLENEKKAAQQSREAQGFGGEAGEEEFGAEAGGGGEVGFGAGAEAGAGAEEFGAEGGEEAGGEPEGGGFQGGTGPTPAGEFNVGAEESFKMKNNKDNKILNEFIEMDKKIIYEKRKKKNKGE